MNKKLKIEILYFATDIKDLFATYKDKMSYDIKDTNLKNNFCSFLEELLEDGSIRLSSYTDGMGIPLNGTSKEQVQKLKDIWPTLEDAQAIWPEDPWYYLEWLWWDITCTIDLVDLPNIDIYEKA
ncbi:DUF596 domain-containing protein [Neisseria dentiae]|uniref:DUF596 domain-containing protein n=1 Tax=Neisseria dentiae TaxID=194197 RepID=UPI00211C0BBD|nr:DUF596 domain-containing protein [Neisseria dentiae]MCQ9326291.1 DUF596 domain-containing protein [Neisseria dentiae]